MSADAVYLLRMRHWIEWQDEQPYRFGMTADKLLENMRGRLRVTASHLIGFMA